MYLGLNNSNLKVLVVIKTMAIDPKYHYFNQQSKLRIRKLFTSKVLSSQKMTLAIFMEIVIKAAGKRRMGTIRGNYIYSAHCVILVMIVNIFSYLNQAEGR